MIILKHIKEATDFLGFDNGTRNIPLNYDLNSYYNNSLNDLNTNNLNADFPNLTNNDYDEINNISRSFNPLMSAQNGTSLLNYSIGYSNGNQFDVGKRKYCGLVNCIELQ